MGTRARLLLATLAVIAADCAGGPADDGGEDTVAVHLPVTCNPQLDRYPIAGPHNGGYDRAWSNFTCPAHPAGSPDNSDYGGDHHGNDLFAPRGTPVVAVRAGRVTRAGVASSISGNRVTIEDDCGWSYYFGHLNSIAAGVAPGARVTAGQVIGTVGNTGTPTAPHVHFNVHRDGNYNNDVDPFPLLQAADRTACDPTAGGGGGTQCQRRCEGDAIVEGDCSRGNCAAYGSRCVDDSLGARCAFFACRDQGEHDACWLDRYIGRCRNGQLLSQGDCGAFGSRCVSDDLGARCAFFACRDRGEHDACWLGRYIGHCRDGALSAQGDCGAYGSRCVSDALGTRCAFFACPDRGTQDVCFLGNHFGRCRDGALVAHTECGEGLRAVCDARGGRCVLPGCRATVGASSACAPNGRVLQCTDGLPTGQLDCPAMNARCVTTSATTARCVGASEPPPAPFDAGPEPVVDAGTADAGFPLPDVWTVPDDATFAPFDVAATADVPPAGDVPYPPDGGSFFVPDGGMERAEVETFEPPGYDDGEDPCAVCRPLGRCPPQCDADGGADGGGRTEDLVRSGCRCGAPGLAGSAPGGLSALAALAAAILARRRGRCRART